MAHRQDPAPTNPGSPAPSSLEGIRRAGVAAWGLLGILLLAGVVLYLAYSIRAIFPPMALAMMIIFLLNPLVSALERKGIQRTLGTLSIYIVFIAVVVTAGLLLAPPLGRQAQDLAQRIPQIRQSAVATAQGLADRFDVSLDELGLGRLAGNDPAKPSSESSADEASNPGRGLEGISGLFRGFGRFASGALHLALVFVLAPFVALYLLIDLPKIQRSIVYYIPPRQREEWLSLSRRCGQAVGGFFRGQLLVAAIVGVMSSTAFFLLDLPFWLPIGLLAGFFNIIPLVGPFVGGGLAVIVGALTVGPSLALKAALAMVVVQQIDNHFISPKVMGRAVRLHPVAVMMALLLGGTLAGFWGILLGVPALAVAKIIALHFYETRVLGITDPTAAKEALATSEQGPSPTESVLEASRRAGGVEPAEGQNARVKQVAVAKGADYLEGGPNAAAGRGEELSGFPPVSAMLEPQTSPVAQSPDVQGLRAGFRARAARLLNAARRRRY